MGMTIDDAISWLVSITEHEGEDIQIYDDDVKAISIAIDTMRKYQKIEQILSDWINDDFVGMSDYWMGRIKEVIEDGKVD